MPTHHLPIDGGHQRANDKHARHVSAAPKTHPHLDPQDLSAGYAAVAADQAREAEAIGWAEALITDIADEATD